MLTPAEYDESKRKLRGLIFQLGYKTVCYYDALDNDESGDAESYNLEIASLVGIIRDINRQMKKYEASIGIES